MTASLADLSQTCQDIRTLNAEVRRLAAENVSCALAWRERLAEIAPSSTT